MRILKITSIMMVMIGMFSCQTKTTNEGNKSDNSYLSNFPVKSDPKKIGMKLVNRFLEQPHSQYGSPLRISEPRTQITYPDVCVWLGGLWFAENTADKELVTRLEDRFTPLFNEEKHLLPKKNHVDNNVFGALALELYKQTKKEKYLELGMPYADSQWELPENATESEKAWAKKGHSWQTRVWLDDMFMITTIQAQAYRVTKDTKYIDRAAKEMIIYLDSIQLDNGLFNHAPTAPFQWGRGNGWMAIGMTELLRILPENNSERSILIDGYFKMMKELKANQGENGMWKQLVNDQEMWDETSSTAMFTYAMIIGVQKGWLDNEEYGPVARKAWIALTSYIDDKGDVEKVCEGTNIGDNKEHYKNRLALTGDLHGQAPVLWCANALLD